MKLKNKLIGTCTRDDYLEMLRTKKERSDAADAELGEFFFWELAGVFHDHIVPIKDDDFCMEAWKTPRMTHKTENVKALRVKLK